MYKFQSSMCKIAGESSRQNCVLGLTDRQTAMAIPVYSPSLRVRKLPITHSSE